MDKPEYLGLLKSTIVKGKRRNPLLEGILPSATDATQGIPAKVGIRNIDDLFSAGAIQGDQTVNEMNEFGGQVVDFATEHPVSLAAGLAGGVLLPATIPGMLAMGAIGAGSEYADSKIRGEDISGKDLALAASLQGITHGLFGRAPTEALTDDALRTATTARGPIRKFAVPEEIPQYIDASELGGAKGYPMLNYDYIPSAYKTEVEFAKQGIPRLVPANTLDAKGAEKFGELLVGNPDYVMHPSTPEGKLFAESMAKRAKELEGIDRVYSGVQSSQSFQPQQVGELFDVQPQHIFPSTQAGEVYTLPKFSSSGNSHAMQYAHPLSDIESRGIISKMIDDGKITESNLPDGFNSVQELQDRIKDLNMRELFTGKAPVDVRLDRLKKMLPENDPIVQEFIPMHEKVAVRNNQGKGWFDIPHPEDPELAGLIGNAGGHAQQAALFNKVLGQGDQAVLFNNSVDIGRSGPYRGYARPAINKVLASFDHGGLKYPFNYGLWNTSDVRPLAAVPLAAGLGTLGYKSSQGNVR